MDKSKHPLVSVIFPVFNGEDYIKKTIGCVQRQSYSNIEILVINDGSNDNSLDILNAIKKKDSRIKLFSQPNAGMSVARNKGLREASGDYITFVDSDDYIGPEYIEVLVEPFISDYKVMISATKFKREFGYKKNIFTNAHRVNKVSKIEGLNKCLLQNEGFDVSVWAKMFSKTLFEDNYFVENLTYEDFEIIPRLFARVGDAEKIAFTDSIQYLYMKTQNSIMTKAFNEHDLDILKIIDSGKEYINENIPECNSAYLAKSIAGTFGLYRKALWNNAPQEVLILVFEKLNLMTKRLNVHNVCTKKEILVFLLVKLGRKKSKFLIKIITRILNQL